MELFGFLFLILISAITILTENKSVLKYLYLPSLFAFMFIVRNVSFDSDIETYVNEMQTNSNGIYYLREFVFWYLLRGLYSVFQNPIIVFLIMDSIWIFVLYKTSVKLSENKENLSTGLILILSTSFPLFFGYENIYRQLFATVFALYSYSLLQKQPKQSLLIFGFSIFMHNTVLVLLPVFYINKIFNFKLSVRALLSISLSIFFIFLFSYASQFKSGIATGEDLSLMYLIMFILVFLIYLIKFKFSIFYLLRKMPSLVIIIILMFGLSILKFDMISERLGMMFLVFLLFDLYRYSISIKHYGSRVAFRLSLLLIFSLPVLLFDSSRMFLIE